MVAKQISNESLGITNRELLILVTGEDERKIEFDRKMDRNSKQVMWAGIVVFTIVVGLRYILL